jgi:invasion protein IalB
MSKMTERLVVGGAALVIGLVVGWAVRGVAGYSTATDTVTAFQDWRTACPAAIAKDQNCAIVQDILDAKTKSPVARIAILQNKDKRTIVFTMPLGVLLPPGMAIAFGSDPAKVVPYSSCNTGGCLAEVTMDAKLQASFDAGKDGKLQIYGTEGKEVSIPLSLKGFKDAQDSYRTSEARRVSWFRRMI